VREARRCLGLDDDDSGPGVGIPYKDQIQTEW